MFRGEHPKNLQGHMPRKTQRFVENAAKTWLLTWGEKFRIPPEDIENSEGDVSRKKNAASRREGAENR